MGSRPASEGLGANPEDLRKALAAMPAAPAQDEEGGEDDDQTVGEKFAGDSDRLGEASFGSDDSGPGAKYVGPAAGPTQGAKPQLASALSMMKPDSSPQGDAMSPGDSAAKIPMLTANQLQSARDEKQKLGIYGAIADNLANRQSFGNFFLGHMNPHQDASAAFRQQQANIDQGIADTKTLQGQAAKAPEMQYAADLGDPKSQASQERQMQLKMGIQALAKSNMIDPDQAQKMLANVDNLNGVQAEKMMGSNPLLKQAADIQKSQAMIAMAGRRLDQGDQRIGISKDNQTIAATQGLDKDPLLQSTQAQINQIEIDKHTLQTAKIITPQLVHEFGTGIATALNKGKAVGLGQMEMQDLGTSLTKLAALEQMLTNAPQNGASPEIKAQIQDTLDRLGEAYRKIQAARAQQVAVGRNYQNNPAAQQALDQKVQSYGGGGSGVPGVKDVLAAEPSAEDNQALEWARNNPGDPRAFKVLLKLQDKMRGKQ